MVKKLERIAIVRGPGGLPGLDAHAGAWLAMSAAGLHGTWLSGCSAGAAIAAMDASGMYAADAIRFIESLSTVDVVCKRFAWKPRAFWLEHFCDPEPIAELLRRLLPAEFRHLHTPLEVSVTRMDPVPRNEILRAGDLRAAVQASMSIAGVWPYVEIDGVPYSDGGTTRRYPMPPLYDETGGPFDAVFVLDPVSRFADRDRNIFSRLLWNLEQLGRVEAEHLLWCRTGLEHLHWIPLDLGDASALKFNHDLIGQAFNQVSKYLKDRGLA